MTTNGADAKRSSGSSGSSGGAGSLSSAGISDNADSAARRTHSALWQVATDHPAFAGHFPGQPLLPGVAVLSQVLEAALAHPHLAAFIGQAPRIGAAKFLAPVRPGAALVIHLTESPRSLRFEVREGERVAASGQFEAAGTR